MQLRRIISTISLTLIAASSLLGQAQSRQLQGYIGPSLFPRGSKTELMAGFKTGFTIGVGISQTIKHSFVFNPNIEFTAASKEHYNFSLISIHNNLKYYLLTLSRARPYVMAVANISFMNLHQQAFETTETPDPSYSVSNSTNIPVSQITYREPDMKLQFAPTFGLGVGVGVDVPIRLKIVPFIQYSYLSYFSKSSSLINDNFRNRATNSKNLVTQSLVMGIRYNLYRQVTK